MTTKFSILSTNMHVLTIEMTISSRADELHSLDDVVFCPLSEIIKHYLSVLTGIRLNLILETSNLSQVDTTVRFFTVPS